MKDLYKNLVYFVIFSIIFAIFYNFNTNKVYAFIDNNSTEFTNFYNEINLTINGDDKVFNYNLKLRDEATKYIFNQSSENILDCLSNFLIYGNKKLIEPIYLLKYCFVNFDNFINDCLLFFNYKPENSELKVIKNSGDIYLKNAKNGKNLPLNRLIFAVFDNFTAKNKIININLDDIIPKIKDEDLFKIKHLRGHFFTTYSTSSPERKNNIEKALSCFDGLVIKPGEIVSFNDITGRRSLENGYLGAKIIVDGDFIDGVGGGVCQASTTIYNACLVSNISVIEAHPHSLKVNYIAPGFDAMVNFGSSDLKFKNTTDNNLIMATKCDGEKCEVFIYGEENDYKVIRNSQITGEIEPNECKIVSYEPGMNVFEDGFIKYPKNGLTSISSLDYYKGDELVYSKIIRNDKYNPVNGIRVNNLQN